MKTWRRKNFLYPCSPALSNQVIPNVTEIKISEEQRAIEECELPVMNEVLPPKKSVPKRSKDHLSHQILGNQILQAEKDPQLDNSKQYSEAMASVNSSHVQMNGNYDARNDMSISGNALFMNADQMNGNYDARNDMSISGNALFMNADQGEDAQISWPSDSKETVHASPKRFQSFSQNSTGKATCSLVLQDGMDIDVENSPNSGLQLFDMVQSYLKDLCQDTLNSLQSSRLQSCKVEAKYMHRLEGIHKNFSGQKMDMHSPDCGKVVLADAGQTPEDFQKKSTKAYTQLTGQSPPSNIMAAVTSLRKRKSESLVIAQAAYEPNTRDIWEGTPKICAPLILRNLEALNSSKTLKQGVDNGQQRLKSSDFSESPTHDETKCMQGVSDVSDVHLINSLFPSKQNATNNKAARQSKKNTTTWQLHELEKNRVMSNMDLKGRMKKKLNWQDWPSLEEAGTLWKSGVRRSTRIRSRPLEFWRGERFLYGRIYDCLSTVIGIKYSCSEPATMCRKDGTQKFKVQSYVDEKYADIVEFAAMH